MAETSPDQHIFRKISAFGETRGEQRRIQIAKATIESLATLGIQNTTFDSIAKLAKMQRSHIAYYAKTREELIEVAVRFAIASGQDLTIELIKEAKTPLERVCASVRAFMMQAEKFPLHVKIWTLFWNLASLDPTYRLLHVELRQMGRERIEHNLEAHFAKNPLDRQTITYLARAIQALGYGYFMEAASTVSSFTFRDAADHAVRATVDLVQGYSRR